MILDAFSLQGKVAVVSGCDTGLGQGMALGPGGSGLRYCRYQYRQTGGDFIERVTALGRRFLS